MIILNVYMNDYDKPLLSQLVFNTDEEAQAAMDAMQAIGDDGDAYYVECREADTLEKALEVVRDLCN